MLLPSFRGLRTALHPLLAQLSSKFSSKPASSRKRKSALTAASLDNDAVVQQQREQDREWRNNTILRSKRLKRLEELNTQTNNDEESGVKILRIADGTVDDTNINSTRQLLTAGDSNENGHNTRSSTQTPPTLHSAIKCYICKTPYRQLHAFYDQLCPACATLNYAKRHQTADLHGIVALVTGARVKVCMHKHQHACIYTHAQSRIHSLTHLQTRTRTHSHAHIRTHIVYLCCCYHIDRLSLHTKTATLWCTCDCNDAFPTRCSRAAVT